MTLLTGRTYEFEVSVELNDALSLVPGELGTYLTDALFDLDRLALLFPGLKVPEPGERILSVSFKQIGYTRRSKSGAGIPQPAQTPIVDSEQRERLSSIEDATLRISDIIQDLRLVKAKAIAMHEQMSANTQWTRPQAHNAQRLLDALHTMLESHATHIEPLL